MQSWVEKQASRTNGGQFLTNQAAEPSEFRVKIYNAWVRSGDIYKCESILVDIYIIGT
jgi:hypothetical protein